MMRYRPLLFAALLALAPAAHAQDSTTMATQPAAPDAPAAPATTAQPALQHVTVTTALGPFVIALEVERAPLSAAQFLRYVDARRLDGLTFYRALNLGRGYGLIQGGTQGRRDVTFPPIAHESTRQTGLSHGDGAISWARLTPGTAAGDFFIILGGLTALDAQPPESGNDPDGFAVFGHVVSGMDVVRAIMALPVDPNAGEGVMRGQILATPLPILSAQRSAAPPPPVTPAAPVTPTATTAPDGSGDR